MGGNGCGPDAAGWWAGGVWPGGPPDDGAGPLPRDIAAIALAALEAKALRLCAERSGAAEHDAFAFDNDLSLIRSIEAMLVEARNTVHA